MWLSVAHAAARHKSNPGEERRRHLLVRREALSRRLDLSSTARLSIVALRGIQVAHCSPLDTPAAHCHLLALQVGSFARRGSPVGHCRQGAIKVGRCRQEGIRAGRCRLPVAIRRVVRLLVGARTRMLARQDGMSQRCRRDRAAVPVCRCRRVLARCHMRMTVCRQSISAARRRVLADHQPGQRRRPRLLEDGKMIFRQSQPMGRLLDAPFRGVCRVASPRPVGKMSRLMPLRAWLPRQSLAGRAATLGEGIAGKRSRRNGQRPARSRFGTTMSAGAGTMTRTC
jgi:hypothetical protein